MVREAMDFVKAYDPELGNMIEAEYKRQQRNIELIASENIVSEAVMAAMGSVLTKKYAEGYPGKRYYGGCECVDEVERLAISRVCEVFGAKFANGQPHSGAQANMAVYRASTTAATSPTAPRSTSPVCCTISFPTAWTTTAISTTTLSAKWPRRSSRR